MLTAAFLHDTALDFLGGAELSNKAVIDAAGEHGIRCVYDNLADFRKTKQLIRESDFVIVNNSVSCNYEFLLIDFLTECGKPYIRWEHDYNFCAKRTALCFVDRKVKSCCDRERFTAYRKLFARAKLSVFVSPKHFEMHREIYGEAIQRHFILPPPVDVANIRELPKEKNSVCFIGDLGFKKGGHHLIDFARDNPQFRIAVFGSNMTGRELPENIMLKGKQPNKEILGALSQSEYFFFQPVWPEPGGRVAAEAFLAGCKTISNANVGFHSHPFYPAYANEAREAMRAAPRLFWERVKEAVSMPERKLRWKNVLVYKSFGGLGDFLFTIPALHKIAGVSDKMTVSVPNALHGLLKKQLPQYEIVPEDFLNTAHFADYDKIIDLSNYPSYRGDESVYKMAFPSYRRINQHAFRHYLDGVAALHPEIDNSFVRFPYFTSTTAPEENYFTVHPGAGFEAKHWSSLKFGKLITTLLELFQNLHCKLILGTADPKVEELFDKIPERVSIPKGNLEVIGDALAGALFHVGNDSGMTHLAGAFNTPTVTIHGPTGPGTWMSFAEHKELIWGKEGVCHIPCNYDTAINCAHRICLNSVTVERVLKHVLKLLQSILPQQEKCRFIFNPDAQVHPQDDACIIQSGEKELLLEFSAKEERQWFELLVKNTLQHGEYSESFNALLEVLQENELLFKIPALSGVVEGSKLQKIKPDLTIVSHVSKRDSIGRHGILFADMLQQEFSINGIPTREPNADDIEPALFKKLTRNGTPGRLALFTDVLQHYKNFQPFRKMPKEAERKFCYSMFESSAIPEEWTDIINRHFDGVLVPDHWLVDVYKHSGVKKPLSVLPLACYLEPFLNYPLKQKQNEVFTFGISAGVWLRKNITGVIDAFKLAFPDAREKVRLRIHSRNGFSPEMPKVRAAIGDDSRIDFIIQPLSDFDYLHFIASLDAYVQLSMGEGFSVTPREALALGLPVILSDNTAHRAICRTGLAYPVPTLFEVPGYYEAFRQAHGNFCLPDTHHAARLMRELFEGGEKIYQYAQKRREWARQFDVAHMKEIYISTIRKILSEEIR